MNISNESIEKTCPEAEIFESVLLLNNKKILELGCGDATLTRVIATAGENRLITATEVDPIQHKKNLKIDDLPNVNFKFSGSENIPADDNTFDLVFMFKSLHHVPLEEMIKALYEIRRVLKPAGLVYISEPIFDGDFNQVLQIFHNEEVVRIAAFEAIKQVVDNKAFGLVDEIFFNAPVIFENFEQFEEKIIGVTHTEHNLSNDLYAKVKQKFDSFYQKNQGNFIIPNRVDILRK